MPEMNATSPGANGKVTPVPAVLIGAVVLASPGLPIVTTTGAPACPAGAIVWHADKVAAVTARLAIFHK